MQETDLRNAPLSYTGKRWLLPTYGADESVESMLMRLASKRGITLGERGTLIPPSVFPDMQRAVDRIRAAIDAHETIAIFGDYDCDGITATAQLARFFARRGVRPHVRLPHRVRDGYGLTEGIVNELTERGVTLLITCDTGITATREVAVLSERGTDVIVTDHHHLREELPPAYAIIHPALAGHPLPHPSGAGVVFKLIRALEGERWEGQENDIALAMIGTVADLVPLTGDNRTLVAAGLAALQQIGTGPLMELRERSASADRALSSTDIAFRIAPRINAAGRMESPDIALHALLSGGAHLEELDRLNAHRQERTAELLQDIVMRAQADTRRSALVFADAKFPHGLLGLLAGKLTETHGKPSLVATIEGDRCTASLRSPPCYNIAEGLERAAHLLMRFGGHAQAAGCTFALSNLPALEEALCADIETHVTCEALVPSIGADAELHPRHITADLPQRIAALEPFGQGNPEPKFLLRNVDVVGPRTVGSEGAHMQGMIGVTQCIGFNMGFLADKCRNVDIIAKISSNTWNGKTRPQIVLEDMRSGS